MRQYARYIAGRQEERALINKFLSVGGREWVGEKAHRVYFHPAALLGIDDMNAVGGYYDVIKRAWHSSMYGVTDNDLQDAVMSAIKQGGFRRPPPVETYTADGVVVEKGVEYLLLSGDVLGRSQRDLNKNSGDAGRASRRYGRAITGRVTGRSVWDSTDNFGRVVIASSRPGGDKGSFDYPTGWFIEPANDSPFVVKSRGFISEFSFLLVESFWLMSLRGGGPGEIPEAPVVGPEKIREFS
ncbi:MAG: hypothetical protein WC247_12260 [Porticoccaceae bacterium]